MISDITIDRKNKLVCLTLEDDRQGYENMSFEEWLEIAKEIGAPVQVCV